MVNDKKRDEILRARARFAERVRLIAQEEDRRIAGIAKQNALKHKIKNQLELRKLLNKLHGLVDKPSTRNLSPDEWDIPSDRPPWKETQRHLKDLARYLEAAQKVLARRETDIDDVLMAVSIPQEPDLYELISALTDFASLAKRAASIKGKSGHRSIPLWQREATHQCKRFWQEHKGEEPVGYFEGDRPKNAFSRWFCDVMEMVRIPKNRCATLLRQQSEPNSSQ